MPAKGKNKAEYGELPSTLERSPEKAQRTFEKTLESAEETYHGDESRAHRAAWAAVKHSFEKTGDHWEPKDHRGPSDEKAAQHGPDAQGASYGGVDVKGHTKDELLEMARGEGAHVTTHMTKAEIAQELEKANDRKTREKRT